MSIEHLDCVILSEEKNMTVCHPERSEGSYGILRAKALRMTLSVILSEAKDLMGFFTAFRMTINN
jgi:hypothetical protein